MNRIPRRFVAFFLTAAVAALGLLLFLANVRTDQQIQQESAQRNAQEYTPMCDGKEMHSGDLCMRIGGNAKSQTYEEMVEEHLKNNTPETLSANHGTWRTVGLVTMAVGILITALSGFAVLLVLRTRRGRRKLANARGWGYQESEPALLARLGNPEFKYKAPDASGVLSGTHAGFPFLVFDFLEAQVVEGKNTMFVLALPVPLPRIVINGAGASRLSNTSSPEGAQLFTAEINDFVRGHGLGWAAVNGTSLVHRWGGWFSPRPAAIVAKLDQLTTLASMLLAAQRFTPNAPAAPPNPTGPPVDTW